MIKLTYKSKHRNRTAEKQASAAAQLKTETLVETVLSASQVSLAAEASASSGESGPPPHQVIQPGNTYISGYTSSTGFPTTPGVPQPSYGGGPYDAFIVKLNAAGSAAVYATLLGGSGNDQAQ